jgi:hypothetical protein
MKAGKPNLPKAIGVWSRPDSPRVIDARNIFEYMNGAGELYLAYGCDHLEVYEYRAAEEQSILVELYYMKTSDDAYGLLSLDWGGEQISLDDSLATAANHSASIRALYGAGLLRLWSDNLYSRVMAFRETSASRQAVLALGKAIALNRKSPPEPELLKILPGELASGWKLRRDRMGYFRSNLVLNSLYYLSHQNILNLDLSSEAVTAPYDQIGYSKRVQVLLVKYGDSGQAQRALRHFHNGYLPEHKLNTDSPGDSPSLFKIEDGWLGYQLHDRCLLLVFECPDEKTAAMFFKHIQFDMIGG